VTNALRNIAYFDGAHVVSLEAIFLSTFVMISQNRADAKRQALADQRWSTVQEEDRQNKQLIDLSNQILSLTKEVRAFAGKAQEDNDQNKELLGLSKRTLALTRDIHARAGAGEAAEPASSLTLNPRLTEGAANESLAAWRSRDHRVAEEGGVAKKISWSKRKMTSPGEGSSRPGRRQDASVGLHQDAQRVAVAHPARALHAGIGRKAPNGLSPE
jgi:hypothetical protein